MRSAIVTFVLLLTLPACSEGPFAPVTEVAEQEIRAALAGPVLSVSSIPRRTGAPGRA